MGAGKYCFPKVKTNTKTVVVLHGLSDASRDCQDRETKEPAGLSETEAQHQTVTSHQRSTAIGRKAPAPAPPCCKPGLCFLLL